MKGDDGITAWDTEVYYVNKKNYIDIVVLGRELHLYLKVDLLLSKSFLLQTVYNRAAEKSKNLVINI